MASNSRDRSDPAAWLETIAQENGDTIRANPNSTILPPTRAVDTAGKQAYDVLKRLADASSTHSRLEYVETLGQGGMGVVRLATQLEIGREVAVKSLREDRRDAESTLALLREAWIAGSLEHPNVVPVYSLGLDKDGNPIIVLKRIEGVSWDELIDDADAVRERFGEEDLLEWNLKILLQVIDAVRFAHSRGIIHRDLKPDNVMIGEFGEVYLLDWGIALSLRDDGSGRLPLVDDATEMAGTPVYMAPEMLGGSQLRLSERTDIYLLGAVLCEVLTGHPPHQGESPMEIITSIARSEPELPEHLPAELARICRRAMDPDPDGRFERVEQLRLALRGFLQHRDSQRLAADAEARRAELDQALAKADDDPEHHQRIYELFGELRFGFRQAIKSWAGNDAARAGLTQATVDMVEYELALADPRAAKRLLVELADPPADLRARVDAELRRFEADKQRVARLEAMGRDLDFAVGQRTRSFLAIVIGGAFTVFPLLAQVGPSRFAITDHLSLMAWSLVFLLVIGAFFLWARESMTKTAINRRITASICFLLVAQIAFLYGARELGLEVVKAQVLLLLLWFASCGMTMIAIDARFFPATLGYLAAFVAATQLPEQRWWLAAASNGLLTINAVWVWRPPPGEFLRRTEAELAALRKKHASKCRVRGKAGQADAAIQPPPSTTSPS